jgi:hypothetical protein
MGHASHPPVLDFDWDEGKHPAPPRPDVLTLPERPVSRARALAVSSIWSVVIGLFAVWDMSLAPRGGSLPLGVRPAFVGGLVLGIATYVLIYNWRFKRPPRTDDHSLAVQGFFVTMGGAVLYRVAKSFGPDGLAILAGWILVSLILLAAMPWTGKLERRWLRSNKRINSTPAR